MKICSKCQKNQSLNNFNKNKNQKDNFSVWCKNCCYISNKNYREKNKDILLAKKRIYNKNNKEKINVKKREYHKNNIKNYIYNPWNLIEKICSKCKLNKNIENFHVKKQNKNGFSDICKNCEKFRKIEILYKIDEISFNEILNFQDNKCDICKISFLNLKHIHIDHNHETNKIRGLLCVNCNTGIGLLKENINIMQEAIKYIRKHK